MTRPEPHAPPHVAGSDRTSAERSSITSRNRHPSKEPSASPSSPSEPARSDTASDADDRLHRSTTPDPAPAATEATPSTRQADHRNTDHTVGHTHRETNRRARPRTTDSHWHRSHSFQRPTQA